MSNLVEEPIDAVYGNGSNDRRDVRGPSCAVIGTFETAAELDCSCASKRSVYVLRPVVGVGAYVVVACVASLRPSLAVRSQI